MQHSTHMHRVISSSVAFVAAPYFTHYRIKGKILAKICVWICPATFAHNVCLRAKNPFFSPVFNETYFIDKISENTKISNFPLTPKNKPSAGTELFREDGRTDRHGETNSRFS